MDYLIYYLIFINLAGFAAMGLDKRRAKRKEWRIPERTLLLLAAIGGSIGSLLGMNLFHHKTKHVKFTVGIPALLLIQLVALWWFLR